MLAFRKKLAEALILNTYKAGMERAGKRKSNRRRAAEHMLETFPQYKMWNGRKFISTSTQFGQRQCRECHQKFGHIAYVTLERHYAKSVTQITL